MTSHDTENGGISRAIVPARGSLPARLVELADQPAPHVELNAAARAELDWLSSPECWELLTAETLGGDTDDHDH